MLLVELGAENFMKYCLKYRESCICVFQFVYVFLILTILMGCALIKNPGIVSHRRDKKFMDYSLVDRNKMGDYWLKRVEEFHKDNLNYEPGCIVMVGDSIMQGFPVKELFPNVSIINRGISGDRVIGVIARQNESIYDLKPSKVFLLIGSNDAGLFPDMGMDEFYRQYDYLFRNMKHHCPKCEIFIQSVLPIRGKYASANPRIIEINKILRKLSKKYNFHYIDLYSHFRNKNGEMKVEYSDDGVHFNIMGNRVWRDILEPYVEGYRTQVRH